jgi:muramoyltetrapeptide carboxypeptidase
MAGRYKRRYGVTSWGPAPLKIGIVAPAARLHPDTAERVAALAHAVCSERAELVFHPQCFISDGHFAGDDAARAAAFLDVANDPSFGAVWFGRGGYGSGRIAKTVLRGLLPAARAKTYLGYSDGGFLLAGLYKHGYRAVHGSIPHDIRRAGGESSVTRSLRFLADGDRTGLEPSLDGRPAVAFNLVILSMLVGTPLLPDLAGHVVMIEEVSEHLYAIDRLLFHVTSSDALRGVAGIRLGRISDVPENDRPFGQTPEEIVRHWCAVSGTPFLGAADIGHDVDNKIVPFGVTK